MPESEEKTALKIKGKIELRDVILGGQDGMVNVLGLTLGLFAAHSNGRIIIIAALAAGFSEAFSMGAVAYTSASADKNRLAEKSSLLFDAIVVGVTALIGAILPIIPFFFLPENQSIVVAIIISTVVLFGFGVSKAKTVGGNPIRSGFVILSIGIVCAFAGFLIGWVLGVNS